MNAFSKYLCLFAPMILKTLFDVFRKYRNAMSRPVFMII